jgi:hypothetical protein
LSFLNVNILPINSALFAEKASSVFKDTSIQATGEELGQAA